MFVNEWFDPSNIEHLKAYRHLQTKGVWPYGFIDDTIEFGPHWFLEIASKIANQYIRERLGD